MLGTLSLKEYFVGSLEVHNIHLLYWIVKDQRFGLCLDV